MAEGPRRLHRRGFLRAAGAAGALLLLPARLRAAARPRSLSLHNLHTGERLSVVYREGGRYRRDALAQVDHLLRDHRTGEVHPIAPALLDLLCDLRETVGGRHAFEVISGFRSQATNDLLRAHGEGVALHSFHLLGAAADVRLPGLDTRMLRRAALSLARGGVGYYRGPDFVHVDVGPVRSW
jgi:uncharacterized protein YcbK (DUF882 family)